MKPREIWTCTEVILLAGELGGGEDGGGTACALAV